MSSYEGILRVEDGHVHLVVDGGTFLCLNRHDLINARVKVQVITQSSYALNGEVSP